jgi:hypothetical protein
MSNGFGTVGSILTERPQHRASHSSTATSHGMSSPAPIMKLAPAPAMPPVAEPLINTAAPPIAAPPPAGDASSPGADGNRAWYDSLLGGRQYEVLYDDAEGYPLLGFVDGQWYDVTAAEPEPVTVRHAIHLDPAWAGAVVQTVCMWMRSNPHHDRSFELATELALTVGELARFAN